MISLKKTKAIIRIRKSGKDRQNNCQEKKDKRTKTIYKTNQQLLYPHKQRGYNMTVTLDDYYDK
jgi:hypothetical protein